MTTKTVDVHGAQIQLAELLSIVEQGIEIILTDGDKPLARLVPLNTPIPSRIPGLHAHLGAAWVSDDFDDPLPDEFWIGTDETPTG